MRLSSLTRRVAAAALCAGAAAGAAGCNDFLTGDKLTENPNAPIQAAPLQLLVASEVGLFVQQEGQLARIAAIFTQQLSGTNNQQSNYGSEYSIAEADVNTFWNQSYTGTGLIGLRTVQTSAREANDQRLLGIALVLEAMRMGTHTSIWGDVPYSEAAGGATIPKLDPQEQVYAAVQAKLDTAITVLRAVPANTPALPQDVIFNGNAVRWAKAASTLKARFHLHTAERLGAPAYQAALAAAQAGIDEAPANVTQANDGQAPGNLRAFHGQTVNVDANLWSQFLGSRTDITANRVMIDVMQARNDPRLPRYFTQVGGTYRGADQFGKFTGTVSVVAPTPRLANDFRQPLVTWAENQLILAEAKFQTGDVAGALTNVNAVRTANGLAALAGPVTLTQIMEEKYVALFQNIEVWNDYKRTCYPSLRPGGPNLTSVAEIPGRLPYPFSERNANPNIKPANEQPARNWNDPNACPSAP